MHGGFRIVCESPDVTIEPRIDVDSQT